MGVSKEEFLLILTDKVFAAFFFFGEALQFEEEKMCFNIYE